MIKTTLLGAFLALSLFAVPRSAEAGGSTLLVPYDQTRVVGPGDSWEPPANPRNQEILSRVSATRRYVGLGDGVRARVKGRAERRAVRQAAYLVSLEGDRAGMFAKHGRPAYRYYELRAGRERELWTYPEHKFTVIFVKNQLVDKRWF